MTPEEFQTRTGATAAQMADLSRYRDALTAASAVMNLVGSSTLPEFWSRHALDSWQLLGHAPDARTWADLGAGAGLPGVVLAIFLKTTDCHVWLIDSLTKRCRFLQQVVDELGLPATVVTGRAEDQQLEVDVVTARACAPMERLLGYAQPYLDRGAQGLFLKGEKVGDELKAAARCWKLSADTVPSISDPRGRVVRVRSLARAR